MRTASEAGARVARAWACLGANALVLPGLGSILGGSRLSGVLQILSSLGGFVLTMLWAASWIGKAVADGALPVDLGPDIARGAVGILLFAVSWLWGVASGVVLVRQARAEADARR